MRSTTPDQERAWYKHNLPVGMRGITCVDCGSSVRVSMVVIEASRREPEGKRAVPLCEVCAKPELAKWDAAAV